ncbi:MAG: HPr kinase/phosphorylase [Alphaproteobacteria bacterium]
MNLHGTCVIINGLGILLRGPSGSGKSDLALRLLHEGGKLISDDQVTLESMMGQLIARPPRSIMGQMEVRGVGVIPVNYESQAPVEYIFDMTPHDKIERTPEKATENILGVEVPVAKIDPFAASSVAKVNYLLKSLKKGKAF